MSMGWLMNQLVSALWIGQVTDHPGQICRDFIPKDGAENTESHPTKGYQQVCEHWMGK